MAKKPKKIKVERINVNVGSNCPCFRNGVIAGLALSEALQKFELEQPNGRK